MQLLQGESWSGDFLLRVSWCAGLGHQHRLCCDLQGVYMELMEVNRGAQCASCGQHKLCVGWAGEGTAAVQPCVDARWPSSNACMMFHS